MKIVAEVHKPNLYKIILDQDEHGVSVFVFRTEMSGYPEEDYLDESIEQAKERCLEDFGVSLDLWEPKSDADMQSVR